MNKPLAAALFTAILASTAPAIHAQDAGDWIVRAGAHTVQPKSGNHSLVNVDDSESLTFSGAYMLTSRWSVELLAALPFEHDINLNGGGRVATTRHLPPTVSLQYHFNPNGTVRPYAGVGLNYTLFFDEKTSGALSGVDLDLDPSFGAAAQLGVDISVTNTWFVNLDVRYLDIDTDARADGVSIGTVEIDPYAIGLSIGRRF